MSHHRVCCCTEGSTLCCRWGPDQGGEVFVECIEVSDPSECDGLLIPTGITQFCEMPHACCLPGGGCEELPVCECYAVGGQPQTATSCTPGLCSWDPTYNCGSELVRLQLPSTVLIVRIGFNGSYTHPSTDDTDFCCSQYTYQQTPTMTWQSNAAWPATWWDTAVPRTNYFSICGEHDPTTACTCPFFLHDISGEVQHFDSDYPGGECSSVQMRCECTSGDCYDQCLQYTVYISSVGYWTHDCQGFGIFGSGSACQGYPMQTAYVAWFDEPPSPLNPGPPSGPYIPTMFADVGNVSGSDCVNFGWDQAAASYGLVYVT